MLKKLLGVILAAAMVLSLFPATAFATGEVAENKDIMIVYDSCRSTTAMASEPTPEDTTDYYNNVVFNKYHGINPYKPLINTFTDWTTTNGFWKYAGHTTAQVPNINYGQWSVSESDIGKLIAFSFHVPVAGKYNVMASGQRQNSTKQSQSLAFQVFPAGTTMSEIEAKMADVKLNSTGTGAEGNPLGCWLHNNSDNASGEYNFETAGEYIIAFKNVDKYDENANNDKINSFLINHFTLSAKDSTGTETKSVPMGYTKLNATSIGINETATATVSDLYGSGDWAKQTYTAEQITYKSSNPAVATVAADGTVTGKSEGTAEIAAVIDGATLVSAPVTVTAPNIKIVYDIYKNTSGTIETANTDYYTNISSAFGGMNSTTKKTLRLFADYTASNGFWGYAGDTISTGGYTETFYGTWSAKFANIGELFAIKFHVPVAGRYDFELMAWQGHPTATKNYGSDFAYRIFPKGTSIEDINAAMADVAYNEAGTEVGGEYLGFQKGYVANRTAEVHEDIEFETAGEYILVAKSLKAGLNNDRTAEQNVIRIVYFALTQSDNTGILPMGYTKLSSNKIAVDSTTQATISDKLYNANDWMEYDASNRTITYASSNSDVAIVSANGTVTAKAVGTAEITAIVDGAQLAPATITVEDKKISLAVANSVDSDITVEAYKAGSVTIEAPTKSGYTFSHWVRGTADNGVWVSLDANYTFNLVSPTYLTAIYVADDAKIVEFFNGNGELLAQKTVKDDGTVETPVDPSMVGFTFLKWILGKNGNEAIPFVNENIAKSLRVVADYAVESTKYTVGDDTDLVYDAEVVKNADSEDTVWYRGGKPVGYGKTYTYNVWSDTTITSEPLTGEKTPLVYLDTAVKTVGDERAYMIEFDGAGKEIVEVGILFSNSGTPEVGSCQHKATSQTKGGDDGHGQFTAKPANSTQTVARGYLIYNENGEYKTVYSEVLSLS